MRDQEYVTISDFGGANSRNVLVAGVQASWELSAAGSFSAFTTPAALSEAGLIGALAGKWITWAHDAGQWGGVAIGRPASHGVIELAAEGFAVLMRGQVMTSTPFRDHAPRAAASAARLGLNQVANVAPTFIAGGMIDEQGVPIVAALDGTDLMADVLSAAWDEAGIEWLVDHNRQLTMGPSLGTDRTASVVLREDVHILDARLGDDVWALPSSEEQQYESTADFAAAASVVSGEAKVTGRHQRKRHHKKGRKDRHKPGRGVTKVRYPMMATDPGPSAPSLLVDQETLPRNVGLTMLSVPKHDYIEIDTIPVDMDVRNVEDCFALTQLGDTVRIVIESAMFSGQFRVFSRAIDTTTGVMKLAGEAISDVVL